MIIYYLCTSCRKYRILTFDPMIGSGTCVCIKLQSFGFPGRGFLWKDRITYQAACRLVDFYSVAFLLGGDV